MDYLVGGAFIALFVWAAIRSFYLRYWGVATTGIIVALERTANGDGVTYKPVVAFTTREGVRIEAKSMYGTEEAGKYFRVGEQVALRYAASKPPRFAIDGYEVSAVLFLFFFAVAGGMIFWVIT
ncbi:DUF3592 domain-containing protein [Hymenobacter armeniacus]|uniref:DUF3592 domain-containing protein n=1 Tax=Hymenobacter armeniacus TaxID=2771358 RepID=A0ABR8JT19_9BACT|nr:DUF3592 domain-containing protein [Hymenobacter armeniacus]MBD2723127.1 DUF3592 domain-containing protein [Hymenobacter armeniacus]